MDIQRQAAKCVLGSRRISRGILRTEFLLYEGIEEWAKDQIPEGTTVNNITSFAHGTKHKGETGKF